MAKPDNRRLLWILSTAVLGMFGFGFAMVPLYSLICDVTGINSVAGNSGRQSIEQLTSAGVDYERLIKVEFDVTLNAGLEWEVYPMVKQMEVHPGKPYQVSFLARNNSDRTIIAQAIPGVTPWQVNKHFNKTECFCFQQQKLEPGEAKEMPLRFVLDRNLPGQYRNFTLSYTFMDTDRMKLKEGQQLTVGPDTAVADPRKI